MPAAALSKTGGTPDVGYMPEWRTIMRYRMKSTVVVVIALLAVSPFSAGPQVLAAQEWNPVPLPGAEQHPPELIALTEDFRALRGSAVAQLDLASRVEAQKQGLPALRARLDRMDPSRWTVHDQVDYLLLRSEMDELEFDLYVRRHVSRNPGLYVNRAISNVQRHLTGGRRMGTPDLMPYSEERARAILAALAETEAILAEGRANLTEIVPAFADIALRHPGGGYYTEGGELEHIVENYQAWARLTAPHFPASQRERLFAAVTQAGQHLAAFGRWLEEQRPRMTGSHVIPEAVIDWYHRSVSFLPYTTDQLRLLADMERGRVLSYMQFEMHKNRHLPQIKPAKNIEQYLAWDDETALILRRWYVDEEIITDYDFMEHIRSEPGEYALPFGLLGFPYDAKPGVHRILVVPDDHWRAVYSNMGFRTEPGVLLGHEYWPGHTYEGELRRRLACPIRRGHRDNPHSQGYNNFHEELPVALNFPYVRGPRGRELPWINFLQRAERVRVGLDVMTGAVAPEDAMRLFMERIPALGPGVGVVWEEAVEEIEGVLLRGLDHGMTGKLQQFKLLADLKLQLKDDFDFQRFNDQTILHGNTPYALLRWELAGLDDEMKMLREPQRLSDVLSKAGYAVQP